MRQSNFRETRQDLASRLSDIQTHRHPIALLLDQVQDERNVAAMLRLADAARLEKVFLYQQAAHQWKGKKLERIARSTQKYVSFEQIDTIESLVADYHFLAVEITDQSVAYHQYQPPNKKLLLILGNEKYGVSKELLELSQAAVHIPMYGINTSMNVAMSAAIVSYHLVHTMGGG
ncbi:MAG: TrmH family RNA methyltransferase [Bacteroidota bacterium]